VCEIVTADAPATQRGVRKDDSVRAADTSDGCRSSSLTVARIDEGSFRIYSIRSPLVEMEPRKK